MPAAEAPINAKSRAEALYHPDDSDNDLHREIRATGMMVVGAWVRKLRYGGLDHFWMFLVSLFSSSLLRISARYKWRRHGFYHLQMEVEFPRAPDPPKGRH